MNNLSPALEEQSLSSTVKSVINVSVNPVFPFLNHCVVTPSFKHGPESKGISMLFVELEQTALLGFFFLVQFFDITFLVVN
jgi:hypothetical protein